MPMPSTARLGAFLRTPRAAGVILTLASLAFTLLHAGPLHGSLVALILTVGLQVTWPGVVLTRALGLLRRGAHPLVNLTWILTGGMGLTIVLGGLARLLMVPVVGYELILHGLLIGLILLPARPAVDLEPGPPWRFERVRLPLYALLVGLCVVLLVITAARRQQRFTYYPDETVFAGLASWIANAEPDDLDVYTRRVGRPAEADIRMFTDGWTYDHAAWEWSSGVPASWIVWTGTSVFFSWLIPLLTFAGAYVLTRKETLATWAAAALTLLALLSIDNFAYGAESIVVFGRSVFELGFLRDFSTTVMLPMTLFTLYVYWQRPQARILVLAVLSGVALGMTHARQVMILAALAAPITALWWLVQPRARFKPAVGMAIAVALIMGLPLVQRLGNVGNVGGTADMVEAAVLSTPAAAVPDSTPTEAVSPEVVDLPGGITVRPDALGDTLGGMTIIPALVFDGLPLLGSSYIIAPEYVYYHPLLILATILGLAAGLRWRRSLAAQVAFVGALMPLVLLFVPGITPLFIKFVSFSQAPAMIYGLPVGLILGGALEAVIEAVVARRAKWAAYAPAVVTGLWALLFVEVLWEPIPIHGSAADQLRAINEVQSMAHVLPAEDALSRTLQPYVPGGEPSIVLADVRATTVVQEDVPYALVTGGRPSGNLTYAPTARFFTEAPPYAPWLDAQDMAFLRDTGVTHVILRADSTRLAQILLQLERFPPLDAVDGYLIFGVGDLAADPDDDLFAAMNTIYAGLDQPRWGPDGFALVRPADPAPWRDLAARWEVRLAAAPEDDSARLGLAFTRLMMGADDEALPLWEALHTTHPDAALIGEALALTQAHLDDPAAGRDTLLAELDAPQTGPRLLAARRLLSADFSYLLDDAQLDHALAVAAAEPDAWQLLAELDRWPEVRQRAALLIGRGRLDAAAATLDALPIPEQGPDDLITLAMIRLMQGDPSAALATLQPATEPDQIASRVFLHPDRWADHRAAQFHAILEGNLAERDGDLAGAIEAYRRAVASGSEWTGRAFLAEALDASGQTAEAETLRADLQADWEAAHDSPLPAFASLLDLDPAHPYASHLAVTLDDASGELTLTFDAASQPGAYAVREWRIVATSPEATTQYAGDRLPAVWVEGALTRATAILPLPADLPELTPLRVFVQPLYDNQVAYPAASAGVIAHPPTSAPIPPEAIPLDVAFADGITLHAATVSREGETVTLTLYWEASAEVSRDYQVFVHALDAAGESLQQADSAPLDGRYPTGQWRAGRVIADPHILVLPEGADLASLYVGLYALPETTRLPVTDAPPDVEIISDGVMIPAAEAGS